MIAVKLASDLREGDRGLLSTKVHRELARVGDPGAPLRREQVVAGDATHGADGLLNRANADGVRSVDLTASLREELRRSWRETTFDKPDDYVLPTPTGRQSNPSNLRRDVLRPAIKRANEELVKDGIAPIDAITFHSL